MQNTFSDQLRETDVILLRKMKRTGSQEMDPDGEMGEGDFKRGGLRATAGARLGWSKDLRVNE